MKVFVTTVLLLWLSCGSALNGFCTEDQSMLIHRMRQYENSILDAYLEYQKLYYEDKSRVKELTAFEDLLTVYIDQVMEIYETLTLAQQKTQTPRDIAARTLIFKALMYLEKAPLNTEYYEYACYEYFKALDLYKYTEDQPVIYKDLPRSIQTGNKNYYRLIDLLEDKGQGIKNFSKVNIAFKNFKVTANFDPRLIEILKIPDPNRSGLQYTYKMTPARITKAFEEVFAKNRPVETYVALPQGTYILRLKQGRKSDYTALTTLYVRSNQEQNYIMEPLGDWIVLYEVPNSKKPDFFRFRRNKESLQVSDITGVKDLDSLANSQFDQRIGETNHGVSSSATHLELVEEVVTYFLNQFDIKLLFDLNDPEIKDKAVEIISRTIVDFVESPKYYNQWSQWTASWEMSKEIRELISPGSPIPIELVKLIYQTLKQL
ncbi:MAG: hypothetical protein ACE5HO_17155 [bacterium]